jgi:hypothetical protein
VDFEFLCHSPSRLVLMAKSTPPSASVLLDAQLVVAKDKARKKQLKLAKGKAKTKATATPSVKMPTSKGKGPAKAKKANTDNVKTIHIV